MEKEENPQKNSTSSSAASLRKKANNSIVEEENFKTGTDEIDEVIQNHELSRNEIKKLRDHLDNFTNEHRLRSVFLCRGEECISAHMCPFLKIDRSDLCPIGKKCPIDMAMANKLYNQMYQEVTKDGDSMDVFTETYIQELVAIELYLARIHDKLASDDEYGKDPLLDTRINNINNRTGEAYTEKIEHPLVLTMQNLLNRKDRILKALLLTPEARARHDVGKTKSLVEQMREVQNLASKNIKEMKEKGNINLEDIKKRASVEYANKQDPAV